MTATVPALLFLLWLAAGVCGAQESVQAAPALDLASLVGLTLPQTFELLGAPEQMFSARGEEGWQDDVVFYYPSHLYLFWYRNRVWQARVDEHYLGYFLAGGAKPGMEAGAKPGMEAGAKPGMEAGAKALAMGRSREEVLAALGPPMREIDNSLVYHLEDRGYPVRLRLYFRDGQLADAYCFRGDL